MLSYSAVCCTITCTCTFDKVFDLFVTTSRQLPDGFCLNYPNKSAGNVWHELKAWGCSEFGMAVLAWTIQAHLSGNSSVTWYLSLRISAFEMNRVNVGTDNYFLELNNLIGPPKSCQKLSKRSHKIVMWKRETLYGKQHCNGRLWIHYKSNQNFSSNKTG